LPSSIVAAAVPQPVDKKSKLVARNDTAAARFAVLLTSTLGGRGSSVISVALRLVMTSMKKRNVQCLLVGPSKSRKIQLPLKFAN
jgi:hypothetical protein